MERLLSERLKQLDQFNSRLRLILSKHCHIVQTSVAKPLACQVSVRACQKQPFDDPLVPSDAGQHEGGPASVAGLPHIDLRPMLSDQTLDDLVRALMRGQVQRLPPRGLGQDCMRQRAI